MVSPNLVKNSEKTPALEINENTKKLFQVIYTEKNKPEDVDENIPKIKVSSLVSRLAFFYEKARNAIDYAEEHLLRKTAIVRILKRQIVIEGVLKQSDSEGISRHLLTELIRGGYLPNNSLPETRIKEIAVVLEKYIRLKNYTSSDINASLNFKTDINKVKDLIREKNSLVSWFLELAASEIEENLAPDNIKKVIVGNMFDFLSKNIKLPTELAEYEPDLEIQIYLSIARNFLRFDKDLLSFVLFKYYNSFWLDLNQKEILSSEDEQKIENIADNIEKIKKLIDNSLDHPLAKQLDKLVKIYSLYFSILTETVEADPLKIYGEVQKGEKVFLASVKKVCNQKYLKAKSRLWRSAVRSIIYIFLTKSIFVIAIEIPAINWFGEKLNLVALGINIAFPAVLLFFIVLLTRTPGTNNTDKILSGIKEIVVLNPEKRQPMTLKKPRRRNFLVAGIFNIIYSASFCFSVYFIIKGLTVINFNWVSITIFLFFLAFVSFFSIVTTKGVKELLIVERGENLFTFLGDLFFMPIILVGRWLSNKMSKVNVFVFIFDFIIEAPFKILVDIFEDWTKYVRERRENMD
jgi:hypothetical protein